MCRKIAGRCAEPAAQAADPPGNQARIRQRSDTHGDIDSVRDEVRMLVAQRELDLKARVSFGGSSESGQPIPWPEQRRTPDAEQAAHPVAAIRKLLAGKLDVRHAAAATVGDG